MHFEFYKNILSINKYRQIIKLENDLILLEKIGVYGKNLKILKLDNDSIVISGLIEKIELKEA